MFKLPATWKIQLSLAAPLNETFPAWNQTSLEKLYKPGDKETP